MKTKHCFFWLLFVGCIAFLLKQTPENSIPADIAAIEQSSIEPAQPSFSNAPQLRTSDGLPCEVHETGVSASLSAAKDFHSQPFISLSANGEGITQNAFYTVLSRFVHSSAVYQKRFFAALVLRYLLFENWRK